MERTKQVDRSTCSSFIERAMDDILNEKFDSAVRVLREVQGSIPEVHAARVLISIYKGEALLNIADSIADESIKTYCLGLGKMKQNQLNDALNVFAKIPSILYAFDVAALTCFRYRYASRKTSGNSN